MIVDFLENLESVANVLQHNFFLPIYSAYSILRSF